MKTIKITLIACFFALFMSACFTEDSVDVNQDKIFSEYELFYDSNQDITYAKAKFKFSNATGTTFELSSPSTVSFNGQKFTYDETFDYYEKQFTGYIAQGNFLFKDAEGKEYSNSVSLSSAEFPSINSISKNSSYEMSWNGPALQAQESVAVILLGKNGGSQLVMTEGAGKTSILFPKNQLEQIESGEMDLIMDRAKNVELQQKNSAGGTLIAKYRAKNITVTLN